MANVPRTYTPANIFEGPVDVYLGITAPTSSLIPLADANCLTLDANGQPSSGTGYHIGSVEGPTSIMITEKCNEIRDDQHESPIDVGFDSTEAEIDITVKETTLTRLKDLLTSGALAAYNALANSQALQVGGQFDSSVSTITLTLVSPRRDAAGKFLYALFYKCFLNSAMQTSISRKKESVWKLKFRAVCDLTRVQGDELAQIVRTK